MVNEYLSEVNKKFNEELVIIIKKIKEFNSDYSVFVVNENEFDIEILNVNIIKIIEECREVYKKLLKEYLNVEFDYEIVKFVKINDFDVYINLEVDVLDVKVIVVFVRDKF